MEGSYPIDYYKPLDFQLNLAMVPMTCIMDVGIHE